MTFCFKCPRCGQQVEHFRNEEIGCGPCFRETFKMVVMQRDYRAEGVGIGRGVRVSRDGTEHEMAKLFLPDNSEFAGPGDPDGTKGMREWHDTHRPKEGAGDRSLVPGRIDKRSF